MWRHLRHADNRISITVGYTDTKFYHQCGPHW